MLVVVEGLTPFELMIETACVRLSILEATTILVSWKMCRCGPRRREMAADAEWERLRHWGSRVQCVEVSRGGRQACE